MGCALLYQLSNEHEVLSKRFSQIVAEKNSCYNDKILLEDEIAQLKKNAYQALHESETIKAEFDEHQSTESPEMFETMNAENALVADILEIDWKDGDRLLEAMTAICPSSLPQIEKLKSESAILSSNHATLKDFLAYFVHRYDFFNYVWKDALAAQGQVDLSVRHLKEDIVAGILAVEPFIGKRSDIDNELHTEYRRIAALLPSEFLVEQRNIMQRLTALRTEMMHKKLDEKDAEKQRVIHLFQHEIAKINDKHQAEQTRSKAELMKEYGDQLKKEFDMQAEQLKIKEDQFHIKEEQYKSQINMLSEDLLANIIRLQQRQEGIRGILSEEIEQRVHQMRLMQEANRQEKTIISIMKYEEIQKAKKETEMLKSQMMKSSESHREEIENLKAAFAKKESDLIAEAQTNYEIAQKELSKTIEAHKEEIINLKLKFAKEESSLIKEAKIESEALKAKSRESEEKHSEELERMRIEFENNASRMVQEANNECERLRKQATATEEIHIKEIEHIKVEFAKKESGLLKDAIMQCEKLKKERAATLQVHKDAIERLKADFSDRESSSLAVTQLEYKNLESELSRVIQSHKQEIDQLKVGFAEELAKVQQQNFSELHGQNKVFEELQADCWRQIEAQKHTFEEKMASEQSKHASELRSVHLTVEILTKEVKMKEKQILEIQNEISMQKSSENLLSQIISVLESKIELIDIECEGRIRTIGSRYFPRLRNKESEQSDQESEKASLLARLRAVTDLQVTTTSEQLTMRDEAMNILKRQQNKFENALLEFEMEVKMMRNQLDGVTSAKTEADNHNLKLKTQVSEKNKRMLELETAIESLKKKVHEVQKEQNISRLSLRPVIENMPESPAFEYQKGGASPKQLESPLSTGPDENPGFSSMTITGPPGTPYNGREYRVMIECGPGYPRKPPKVKFLTKINLKGVDARTGVADGKMKGIAGWNENSTIETLLQGLKKEMMSPGNKKLPQPPAGI